MKYYIKKINTRTGDIGYKAHCKAQGWYDKSNKDIAWKFSKAGAKKIIERGVKRKACVLSVNAFFTEIHKLLSPRKKRTQRSVREHYTLRLAR